MKPSPVAKPAQKTYSIKSTTNQIHLLYAENWQEARRKGREWCKESKLKFLSVSSQSGRILTPISRRATPTAKN